MSSHSTSATKLRLRELTLLALLAALMFATQVAMASLPNIHLVGVLLILTALLFGWRALYALYVFVLLEGLIYGFGLWFINYLYVWTVLAAVAIVFRKNRSRLFWAAVAGIFGLSFGALCSIPYFFIGGWAMGFSYWVAGSPSTCCTACPTPCSVSCCSCRCTGSAAGCSAAWRNRQRATRRSPRRHSAPAGGKNGKKGLHFVRTHAIVYGAVEAKASAAV